MVKVFVDCRIHIRQRFANKVITSIYVIGKVVDG